MLRMTLNQTVPETAMDQQFVPPDEHLEFTVYPQGKRIRLGRQSFTLYIQAGDSTQ
jgi:hypothetical protein